jgi:hypothetical protein
MLKCATVHEKKAVRCSCEFRCKLPDKIRLPYRYRIKYEQQAAMD